VSDLPKPDLLHIIQIAILDHVQKWVFHLMKTHKQLDKYNAIWLSVPAYQHLTLRNKSHEEVSQWNGKEMKEMSLDLLGVVTQSLRGRNHAQRPRFICAVECTQVLLEFYMYARYKSQDDATLSYIQDALHHFHSFKDVFLLRQASVVEIPDQEIPHDSVCRKLRKWRFVRTHTPASGCIGIWSQM